MTQTFNIKTSALFGIDLVLNELGAHVPQWLNRQQCDMAFINTPNNAMPIADLVALLQRSATEFECSDFGLRLGSKQDFRILGPLGLLLQNCVTPRQALNAAKGFMTFHNQAEYWDYTEQGHNVYLRRYDIFHELTDTRQYKELSFSGCYQLCRLMMGTSFRGVRIELSHAPLSKPSVYEKYFKMPVVFNCEQDQLVIPAHYLDAPIPNADRTIHAFAQHYLLSFNQQHDDIVLHVSSLIEQTMSDQSQSIDSIAGLLGINRRTLQRRLGKHNVVFKALLHDIRMKSARWYLASSHLDMTRISEILGYSDISGFSRAFKKTNGLSPIKWKQSHTGVHYINSHGA